MVELSEIVAAARLTNFTNNESPSKTAKLHAAVLVAAQNPPPHTLRARWHPPRA